MTESIEVVVRSVTDEAECIRSFELVRPEGGPLPGFSAGAHIDVHTPNGKLRQYSLVNDERETYRYIIAVQNEETGRGGSRSMHVDVGAGTLLRIGMPRNAFPLGNHIPPTVLLAGGIGVTPLLAMARSLQARGKPFEFHFATRSRASTPFLDQLLHGPFKKNTRVYHDDQPGMKLEIDCFVDQLLPQSHLYLCGPSGFMSAVSDAAEARGDIVLHREYFGAPVTEIGLSEAFSLELARSGIKTTVAADQNILEVLQSLDIDCATSCEEGICGTCLTKVLAGEIDHRDHFLSASEKALGDRMLVCVSRCKVGSKLILDL
ncbi:PDR/VanB family oxidoreductase [Leisingera thetidis]|uniref:PDR/VanB family oxidoreductase n=1 Tax=Leisingera thetidis TaxID=2930199 RepID=UPI0021F69DC7|nr:PDR/VanB family oxidoreductase [Leisingera thetidis]